MSQNKTATFRFYEELNDFLPRGRRKVDFEYPFIGSPKIKEVIEHLGIPHSEVDLIIVNGNSKGFDYSLQDQDRVAVYPIFEALDISPINHLRPEPLREPKFILDVHLGRLAKYLRICGFDCLYELLDDDAIIELALKEQRIILTKDKGLLKNKQVTHGYWVRNKEPRLQLLEIIQRFHLQNKIQFLVRCLLCNSLLSKINKQAVAGRVPTQTTAYYQDFYECLRCNKIYWEGSHYQNMTQLIDFILQSQKLK